VAKFGCALGASSVVLLNAIGKCMGFVPDDAIASILPGVSEDLNTFLLNCQLNRMYYSKSLVKVGFS